MIWCPRCRKMVGYEVSEESLIFADRDIEAKFCAECNTFLEAEDVSAVRREEDVRGLSLS